MNELVWGRYKFAGCGWIENDRCRNRLSICVVLIGGWRWLKQKPVKLRYQLRQSERYLYSLFLSDTNICSGRTCP